MRTVLILIGLVVVFLIGGYVDHTYNWPFGLLDSYRAVPLPSGVAVPYAATPAGQPASMQSCVDTMIGRGERETEARQVCQKIISGITR